MGVPYILVCDDTKNIADSLVVLLKGAGHAAEAVTSALEAVSVARKYRPSLLLMDVMMPGMDGATAVEAMRDHEALRDIPVVLLSALPEDELRAHAERCGAAGWLAKPFSRKSLLEAVEKVLPAAREPR